VATYLEVYEARYAKQDLERRIVVAVARAAYNILREGDLALNHAKRLAWAKQSLSDEEATRLVAGGLMWAVLLDPKILDKFDVSLDADLQAAMDVLIDALA